MQATVSARLRAIIQDMFELDVEPVFTRPDEQFGDLATNIALQLAGRLGKSPREIAESLAAALQTGDNSEVDAVTVAGPGFLNIRLSDGALLAGSEQATVKSRENMPVVIETNNPNPFKAMHIGHAFNAILADTVANLLEASGAQTSRVSYHGDVGAHVGKSMYALLRYVDGDASKLLEIPELERNSFMSRMYAEGARAYKEDETAKAEIDELAKESFSRVDSLYQAIYSTVFTWSFEQIDATVARLGNKPTVRRFLESEADARGVETVRAHVPDVFQESDGALIFKGSEHGAFDNVFVGANGRGLYAARDLGLMQLKNDEFHPQKSYIVTAEEQRDYFKGVIAAAELCLPELKGVTANISTGTVKLTTGKMSSRTGEVVEIGWLFDQVADAVRERGGEASDELIAAALRYQFLKVRIGNDVVFDVNEAVSLQGNSGPYLQYAHARACSILTKAGTQPGEIAELTADERSLVRKMSEYSDVIDRAITELLPHHVTTYLYELAQKFNQFYEHNRVIGDEREAVRLALVTRYRDILARGLELLGMAAPERM